MNVEKVDETKTRRASGLPGRSLSLIPKMSQVTSEDSLRPNANNRVVINVGGVRYETYKSTLKAIPDTRLSWLTQTTAQNADFDPETGEFFFDRHPGMFNMVLNYYRTGKLHAPVDVCGPLFEEELAFWGIDEKQIEPCCWMTYRTHRDAQETLAEFDGGGFENSDDDEEENVAERFGIEEEECPQESCWQRYRPRIWLLLEEPNSSRGAKIVACISLLFILLSIATFCLETHLSFRIPRNESIPINSSWNAQEKSKYSRAHPILENIDLVCILFFTIEFGLRFTVCPDKLKFWMSPLNWVDILSIIPFFIERIIVYANEDLELSPGIQFLKTVKLIRIFRILKLTKHFSGLKILSHTIRASAKELLLLIIFLLLAMLIFSCLVYYAEAMEEHPLNDFTDIPLGFWWAVVTMTTIGYGDMAPRTGLGYLVGGICAVTGVLVLALPVPVIVNNFALYYSHAQARMKLPKKRKKVLVGAADALKTQTSMPGSPPDGTMTPSGYQVQRSPSPVSISSSSSDRKGSDHSNSSSDDSGIKTGDCNVSAEGTGVSVIFTDEVASLPSAGVKVTSARDRARHSRNSLHGASPAIIQNGVAPLMRHNSYESPRSRSRPEGRGPFRRNSIMPQPMHRLEEHFAH